MFPRDTILLAMYGATAGKTSIVSFETTTNQAICAIMPNQNEYRMYLKFTLDDLYKYLVNLSSGSARDNLSQTKIKNLKIVVPEFSIIENYHKVSERLFHKIENNLQQNQELSALRDWLLPMLMNGQVRVSSE